MYIYVNLRKLSDYYSEPGIDGKIAIEKATGEPTLLLPFEKLSEELVKELNPKAIIFSGFSAYFDSFKADKFKSIYQIMENIDIPMLAICGSHQLLGKFYNEGIENIDTYHDEPIRKLNKNDIGPLVPGERADLYFAHGYFKINKIKNDPIFEGLNENMYLKCLHYDEIKELPEEFELLATSEHTKIEAIKHKSKLLYGMQFHPERYEEPYLDGEKILINFKNIVNKFWDKKNV